MPSLPERTEETIMTNTTNSDQPGLLGSVLRAGQALVRSLATRLEILSTEIAEERLRLVRLAFVGLMVVFALQAGLLLALLFLVLFFGPEHRLAVVGTAALVLSLGGATGGFRIRR